MDVITAGTTQAQQAAGKTNHTPEDVSDLRQNFRKEVAGLKSLLRKGLMKYTVPFDYFQLFSKPSCLV